MELSRASFAESSPIFLSSSFSARLRSPTNVPYDSGREYMRSITRIVIRKCKLLRNGKTFCEGAEYETLYSTESNETRPPSNLRLSNVGSDPIRNGTPPLRERRIDLQGFTKLAILRSSLSPQSRPSFFLHRGTLLPPLTAAQSPLQHGTTVLPPLLDISSTRTNTCRV
jgi:hypothetical protein